MKRRPQRRPLAIAAVAWFRADQWELLRSLAADPEKLEETHAAWEAIATKAMQDLTRRGLILRKVPMDVMNLLEWCRAQQRPLDGAARAAYASELLSKETGAG
jgi:hypothetical protein